VDCRPHTLPQRHGGQGAILPRVSPRCKHGKSRTRQGRQEEFWNLPKKVYTPAEHVRRGLRRSESENPRSPGHDNMPRAGPQPLVRRVVFVDFNSKIQFQKASPLTGTLLGTSKVPQGLHPMAKHSDPVANRRYTCEACPRHPGTAAPPGGGHKSKLLRSARGGKRNPDSDSPRELLQKSGLGSEFGLRRSAEA
jgi:hypothetical protein